MKSLQVSEDILPLGVFKARAAQVLHKLREVQRPLVITQHGKPVAVLITPEEFDRLAAYDRFMTAVQKSLADAKTGRVIADQTLTNELNTAFPTLNQS